VDTRVPSLSGVSQAAAFCHC